MVEVKGTITSEIKRCMVDLKVTTQCPKCLQTLICNLNQHYFSYPTVGSRHSLYFYCDYCDKEYEVETVIKDMSVTIAYDLDDLK